VQLIVEVQRLPICFSLKCEKMLIWSDGKHNGNTGENEAQQEGNESYELQRSEIWALGNPVSCRVCKEPSPMKTSP